MSNWLSKGNKVVKIEQMSNTHLQNAYYWACKRYTSYHNEVIKDNFDNFQTYKTLYKKLREMELVSMIRGITLNMPPIQLVQRDKQFYWATKSPVS